MLTGRHVTRRCDGDSVAGAAFCGPIFYGHAAAGFNEKPDHPGNVYWYQAVRANEVFQMLDGRQRDLALLGDSREENGTDTVKLTGKKSGLPGISMAGLSRDQKEQVPKVMADVLAPFRKAGADEAMKLVEAGGFDHLHMAFCKNQLLVVTHQDMAIDIRGRGPDHVSTIEGMSGIEQMNAPKFLITLRAEARADEVALMGEEKHRVAIGGEVNAGAILERGHGVRLPNRPPPAGR